jgi:hypothetical protein
MAGWSDSAALVLQFCRQIFKGIKLEENKEINQILILEIKGI